MSGTTARRTLKTSDFDPFQTLGREEEQRGGAENMDTDALRERMQRMPLARAGDGRARGADRVDPDRAAQYVDYHLLNQVQVRRRPALYRIARLTLMSSLSCIACSQCSLNACTPRRVARAGEATDAPQRAGMNACSTPFLSSQAHNDSIPRQLNCTTALHYSACSLHALHPRTYIALAPPSDL